MTEEKAKPVNFIEKIINEALASGKHSNIITRCPPEPNSYLHIGRAKSICLTFGLAQQFGGQCTLRFDDPNSENEGAAYVQHLPAAVRR